jgi:hypothetical protein
MNKAQDSSKNKNKNKNPISTHHVLPGTPNREKTLQKNHAKVTKAPKNKIKAKKTSPAITIAKSPKKSSSKPISIQPASSNSHTKKLSKRERMKNSTQSSILKPHLLYQRLFNVIPIQALQHNEDEFKIFSAYLQVLPLDQLIEESKQLAIELNALSEDHHMADVWMRTRCLIEEMNLRLIENLECTEEE